VLYVRDARDIGRGDIALDKLIHGVMYAETRGCVEENAFGIDLWELELVVPNRYWGVKRKMWVAKSIYLGLQQWHQALCD
jgi:hypothetical protein